MVTNKLVRFPMIRPVFPRINSKESGFFFCGIREEPVVKLSGNVINPNSVEFHSIKSSASLDKCKAQIEQVLENSTKRSRSATASIPFAVILGSPFASTKPSTLAVKSRSRVRVVPAMAPEPKGQTLACSETWENLS